MRRGIDRPFLILVVILVVFGFFIFSSASLGLLARDGARFSSVAFSQIVFGIIGGSILLFITSNIHYRFWRKYSLYFFIASIIATLLVFLPGVGFEFGGARRWILIGSFSFQPAELLKIGFVIYFAAWLSGMRHKIEDFKLGVVPFGILLSLVGGILLLQPDTGTFLVIAAAGAAMFFVSGARWRDVFGLGAIAAVLLAGLAYFRPYIRERIFAFLDPSFDPLGSSYQIQQSLIAVGSGQWFGRGFGQSIQKFDFLPEPIGDSIFAVAAEEFGFIGSVIIILLFLMLAFRALKIATNTPDYFSSLLVVGITVLIVFQSFVNIGSMLGVFPLTGLPLLFVSHGGTALMLSLAQIGIVLNVSKYTKRAN